MSDVKIDDLEELWKAGAVNMQQVAGQFGEAGINLHKAGVSESSVFEGADPKLTEAWARLRNMFQDKVLYKSYEHCVKSGNALANIAISISKQDTDNEEDLKQIIKQTKNSDVDDDRPPSYVPEAPKSGDEHPREYPAGPGDFR
ncbi:MAG TPA: hypothetical protein H9902_01315 [Candidatus Stackebrandtia faecavium]|nr:hypothetical protein [Candidatus Stackebrandtia faecavium]